MKKLLTLVCLTFLFFFLNAQCPLNNGGFENGLSEWNITGDVQISNDARSGSSAIRLCDPQSEIQQIIPTQPGIRYEVAISGKPENGHLNTFYRFRALDANWQPLELGNLRYNIDADFVTQSNPPGSYYDKRWFFTTPSNATWLQVVVWNQDAGCIVIDDIELCEYTGGCDNDNEPPVISNCPPDITSEANRPTNGSVFLLRPLATDNCGIPTISRDPLGSIFPIGTTQVTYTATDDSNNSSTCSVNVTVTPQNSPANCNNDTEPPVILECPSDISSVASGQTNGLVGWAEPIAIDNCGTPSLTSNRSSGTYFPLGTTEVIYTATDDSNNTSNCSFNVTLRGQPEPTGSADIDLGRLSPFDLQIPKWSTGTVTFVLGNSGVGDLEDVEVTFTLSDNVRLVGGNEYQIGPTPGLTLENAWTRNPVLKIDDFRGSDPRIPGPGTILTISFNVYSITNEPMYIYGEVTKANGDELDSTPGNGNAPTPNEDDEAVAYINGGAPQNLPDLSIQSLRFVRPPSTVGEPFAYQFDIRNTGGAMDSNVPFEINAFISTDMGLSPDDIPAGGTLFSGLSANSVEEDVVGSGVLPNIPTGNYFLILEADNLKEVQEVSETNNTTFIPFSILSSTGQPDLTVSDLVFDNLTVQTGEVLTYTFNIANSGTGNIPQDFMVRAYLSTDGDLSADDVQDGIVPTGNFDAGLSIQNVPGASSINLPEGDYYLILKLSLIHI